MPKHICVVELSEFGGGIMPAGWQEHMIAELAAADCEVRMGWTDQSLSVQAAWLAEATVLVLQSHTHIDSEFLDRAPKLGLLATPSVGFDNINATLCGARLPHWRRQWWSGSGGCGGGSGGMAALAIPAVTAVG